MLFKRLTASAVFFFFLGVLPARIGMTAPAKPASPSTQAAKPSVNDSSFKWDLNKQGRYVMCLVQDGQGNLWAGTEDQGVWRYDPSAPAGKQFKQFTTKDGLGDDNGYALAIDLKGRVWVGHLNHGVSVFNGKSWQNYDVLEGPLGERVFAMTVCPTDGDVWIGTNAGLTRYSQNKDTWSSYTRADGLPSDQINALTSDSIGTIYAGTQADGIAIASSYDNYQSWRVSKGPEAMPLVAHGDGLPSNLISDMLVGQDDTVYVSTACGLARSHDHGERWSFVRGLDWIDKVRGLRSKPEVEQKGEIGAQLREDYVTSLAEDTQGRLWIGYRQKGFEVRQPQQDFSKERILFFSVPDSKVKKAKLPYVSSILPSGGDRALLSNYGDGLKDTEIQEIGGPVKRTAGDAEDAVIPSSAPGAQVSRLPSRAKSPTVEELNALRAQVESLRTSLEPGQGYFLGEEWRTQGDWVGRYGSRYAMLCASGAPLDHQVVNDPTYRVRGEMGPDFPDDGLRYWIHWLKSDNPRVLYNPLLGYRREAEWDDHGESMPMSVEGPDVWTNVRVPAGVHRISLYFFNKDGHSGNNRLRDYLVELKPPAGSVEEAESSPTLARARVRDFWGGVYKQFVVKGPGRFWLKVGRNNSFNTILNGVFVDKLQGPSTQWETRRDVWLADVNYEVPGAGEDQAADRQGAATSPEVKAARQLWTALDAAQGQTEVQKLDWKGRLLAYRAVARTGWGKFEPPSRLLIKGSKPELQPLLQQWRWKMALWTDEDRDEFKQTMQKAHEALLVANPELKTARY